MQVDITAPEWSIGKDGARISFLVPSPTDARAICEEMDPGKKWELITRKKTKKRSKNANDLLWEMCTRISEKVSVKGASVGKDDIYRKYIKEAGVHEYVSVSERATQSLLDAWSKNGTGWFGEKVDSCHGMDTVCLYYGSSTYDTEQMSRLLNAVMQDASSLGIDTLSASDRALLEQYPWGQRV